MNYHFNDFTLDPKLRELKHFEQPVTLTKQGFDLLLYMVSHADQIHSKDDLVKQVWNGRIVSDNTIDQSISKLRKALNNSSQDQYIEVVYGQGVKFVPEVRQRANDSKASKPSKIGLVLTVVMMLISVVFIHQFNQPPKTEHKSKVMIVPSSKVSSDWSQSGTEQLFADVLNYAGLATVMDIKDKPRFVEDDEYVENQLKITPLLITIRTDMTKQNDDYILNITINHPSQDLSKQFTNPDLSLLIIQAMDWIEAELDADSKAHNNSHWVPQNNHVAELYLRAMDSLKKDDFDKARKQLDLIKEEAPDFYLASFQMAHVLTMQNQHEAALAQLNTLLQLPISSELKIGAISMKAYIFDTVGQYDQAIDLYEQLFADFPDSYSLPLLKARYEYSFVLLNKNFTDVANQQLDTIIAHLNESDDVSLLANVLALKGSVLQRLGQTDQARNHTEQALSLFERNEDALGTAKSYSTLARMANQQANYQLAEAYLMESLAITRRVGFKLGEGATLNELTYNLMVQGQHKKAWELARELEQIAVEIDYTAMLMSAKQLFFDMAREQNNWSLAEQYLDQHLKLAQASNNTRALIKNNMLALNLWVDAGAFDKTAPLVTALQTHINQQQEIRMQPKLDWYKARILIAKQQFNEADTLLQQAKVNALKNKDGETIININNTLAQLLLTMNKPMEANQVLQESIQYKPFALPHLKLLAQTHEAMGNPIKALETMNLCQQQAADLWTPAESNYLKHLVKVAQNSDPQTD